ncbi:MAG: metal-sulfur cluster assembly factor [Elusimicrobia bacterium]|nr:metal-sulfur cluster assembly factor [Elusimicrobiota bacterium]
MSLVTEEQVRAALQPVQDPELFLSILDLGLIYGVKIAEAEPGSDRAEVIVEMTMTSPACPYGPQLLAQAHRAVEQTPGVQKVQMNLVFEPPWDPRTMATEDCRDALGIF